MVKKQVLIILLVFSFLVNILSLTYIIFIEKHTKDDKTVNNITNHTETTTVNSSQSAIKVGPNTKIIFKVTYTQSEKTTNTTVSNKDFIGRTKSDIEAIYKIQGYIVEEFTSKEVILSKKEDRYSPTKYIPGKYILGVKDGYIAIYKADGDGNLIIEDASTDITNIKTKNLKQADIDILTNGDLQFNSKDEAEGGLEDYR